jgi:hypothetical protein
MVIHVPNGVNLQIEFLGFAIQHAIEDLFAFGSQDGPALKGRPNQVVVKSPVGYTL